MYIDCLKHEEIIIIMMVMMMMMNVTRELRENDEVYFIL